MTVSMGLEEEIRELERRFSESPDSRLFLPLADALRRAGEIERAARLCREGLERFPDFTSARVLLGECLSELGEMQEAERNYKDLLSLDKDNSQALKGLADLAARQADTDRALSLNETLQGQGAPLPEEPGPPAVQAAETVAGGGEPGAAESPGGPEAAARQEVQEPPVEDQAAGELFLTHTLADIYRLQGHYGKACEIYTRLLEREGDDPALGRKLEEVMAHLSQPEPGSSESQAIPGRPGKDAQAILSDDGEERIEERIDTIFRYLLGDESASGRSDEQAERQAPVADDPSGFVDMLEDWITGLKTTD